MASSSSSTRTQLDHDGSATGWVEAYTTCPHLHHVALDGRSFPGPDSVCKQCEDPSENWLCLSCLEVLCGRYMNGHMLRHSEEEGHPVAISYRDLSVWCFACDHYLDGQVITALRPAFEKLHEHKFGVPPPPRNTQT